MDEILLEEYKALVLKREKLRKDAWQIWTKYIKEFGDLLEKECALKIECIRYKKIIAFCQAKINRGETICQSDLNTYIETVMEDYAQELEMIVAIKNVKSTPVSDIDYYRLKKLYRKLATMLHPDLHPTLFEHEDIVELWNRVSFAYENNDYEELQTLEVVVVETLKKYGESAQEINIENIEAKIALIKTEIYNITHNDPYRYKELLDDDDAIAEKRAELQVSIDEYEEYLKELTIEVKKFTVEGLS